MKVTVLATTTGKVFILSNVLSKFVIWRESQVFSTIYCLSYTMTNTLNRTNSYLMRKRDEVAERDAVGSLPVSGATVVMGGSYEDFQSSKRSRFDGIPNCLNFKVTPFFLSGSFYPAVSYLIFKMVEMFG